MQTSFKPLTNIHRWRLAAITIGSALALTLANTAFAAGAPVINSPLTATGQIGVAFSYQIKGTMNPTSLNATGLPAGLNVNTTTGLFSGTPTTLGTFSGTISATNAGGTGGKTLTVTINPQTHTAPTSSFTMLPTGVWEGDTVTLDGNASHTNPDDGSPLIYLWQQQAPASPVLALSPDTRTVVVTSIAPTVPLPALTQAVT